MTNRCPPISFVRMAQLHDEACFNLVKLYFKFHVKYSYPASDLCIRLILKCFVQAAFHVRDVVGYVMTQPLATTSLPASDVKFYVRMLCSSADFSPFISLPVNNTQNICSKCKIFGQNNHCMLIIINLSKYFSKIKSILI